MDDIHREAIRRNFSSLVYQTDFDTMRVALTEKGIFTAHMIEHYADPNLPAIEKKRNMYNAIMRRGPQAFEILLETLEENGYWDLVRMLDPNSTLNTISNNASPHTNNKENNNKYVSLTITRKKSEKEPNSQPEPIITPPVSPATSPQNHKINFQVIKSTKFIEDNETNDIRLYRTRGRQRGVLVILNYTNFQDGIETTRAGAEMDTINLKYVFSEIGFKVLAFQDLTYLETLNTLNTLESVLVPELESVFLVVSSHGYERTGSSDTDFRCHDGKLISLQEIIAFFSNRKLPRLRDVPKVFIFQNCRGKNEDFISGTGNLAPAHVAMPAAETDGTPIPAGHCSHTAPKNTALYTNILVVQSTLPGFVSYRDPDKGSWYIQVLCEKFAERAHDTHVDDLFTMVDELLKQRFHKQTSSVDRWGFNRRLYLHPGLFSDK